VLVELADGAEIGGTEEGDPVVLLPVQLLAPGAGMAGAALLEAEAGKADAGGQLASRRVRRHLEIARIVENLARLAALHHMHPHRLLEEPAEMEEGHRPGGRPLRPERHLRPEPDLAMRVVVDPV